MKLLKAKKLLRDAGYASICAPSRSLPAMEAIYFSGFKRGPYKQLISILRNATRNRALIAISFIDKSILEIVTPKNEADRLVIGLEAIGYRHLSKFEPRKKRLYPLSRLCLQKKEKGKILSLPLVVMKEQPRIVIHTGQPNGTSNKRSASAISYFANRLKVQWLLTQTLKTPTRNATRSQLVGQNGIDKSPARQKDTIHQNATTVDASNTFSVLSRAENDAESLDTAAGNNHMEVEEPSPVTNRTAGQDNMDVEILQHTSRQIPNHGPTKTGHNSSNTSPPSSNETQDSDEDSLGSDWDHDGALTYDHELRRPKRTRRKERATLLHRSSYQQEPKREAKLQFPFGAQSPAATSSIRQ